MSTRGYVGIRKNGMDKGGYNHCDSYYSGLGSEVLDFLKGKTIKELKVLFDNIVFIDDDFTEAWDWDNHCLKTQFSDNNGFLKESLFCEYAYIINLDDKVLEIYHGFNKDPNGNGRYANQFFKNEVKGIDQYYGVVLKKTIPLKELFAGKWQVFINDYNEEFQKG